MAAGSVLVAEDDAQLRATLIRVLQQEGYLVRGAADGRAALALLAQEPFDLILLDMHLPHINGWGVARSMRERGLRTSIVVLTAAESARAVAEEVGAVGYVAKPFALLQLLRVLERSLGQIVA
jgi:DNA-binding response OmpR family regulator